MIVGTKEERERSVFAAFLKFSPLFADEPIKNWTQPKLDPPDILCTTVSDRKIGVELRAWLQEEETTRGVQNERRERSVMDALGDQGENHCENIDFVWLYPKEDSRMRELDQDRNQFILEVRSKIAEMDGMMSENVWAWTRQGLSSKEFSSHPVLQKYVQEIRCFPKKVWRNGRFAIEEAIAGQPWIHVHPRVYAYSEQTMLKALRIAIDEKRNHYASLSAEMDKFYLLSHYDQALLYNSPIEIEDAVPLAKAHIGANAGVFDKIFLYLAIHPGEKLFQLY